MKDYAVRFFQRIGQKILFKILPNLRPLKEGEFNWHLVSNIAKESEISDRARINGPYHITKSKIDDYSYVSLNSYILNTTIGKFCSIGPNFISGYGVHPTNGISTCPMFYSTRKQNGTTLVEENKLDEVPPNYIGNDVFIGANVIVLNGIKIGDGAVIGAGSVVSKDIPPYAIAVGAPIKIIKYRFESDTIKKFLKIKWWNKDYNELKNIEKFFFDINKYLNEFE